MNEPIEIHLGISRIYADRSAQSLTWIVSPTTAMLIQSILGPAPHEAMYSPEQVAEVDVIAERSIVLPGGD